MTDIDPHRTHIKGTIAAASVAAGALLTCGFYLGVRMTQIEAKLDRSDERLSHIVTREDIREMVDSQVRAKVAVEINVTRFSCHQFPMRGVWADCSAMKATP